MIDIKKKYIIISCSLIVLLAFVFFYNIFLQNVNVDFTDKITFKYEYLDKNINVQITDENDISTLISICKGMAFSNSPSCGFGTAEILFEGKQKKTSIYPACDSCELMRVNDTEKYFSIGEKNRKKLVEILEKYGAKFPCI